MVDEKQIRAPLTLIRAAEYVRMSTEDQKYSPANQSDAIRVYAAKHGMAIVRTYSDGGISGLTFERRGSLKRLIADVQTGEVDFDVILVYDVSRWGRFQDADESAFYEHVCTRAGLAVHYCAEQFENDGSPLSAIVKAIKRGMAAEFSRELSVKVFAGKRRLIELGFRQGGRAGLGIRRLLVNEHGVAKGILGAGERKSIATDRVVLIPGPEEEVDLVRWIFSAFVHERKSETQIAQILKAKGVTNDIGRPWTGKCVRYLLQSEKYIGNNVWNCRSFKLQKVRVRNNPKTWVRADGAFKPIIGRAMFDAAQAIFRNRNLASGPARKHSDDELLESMRRLLLRFGHLTRGILDQRGLQSSGAYKARFGNLTKAYELAGFNVGKYRKRHRIRPPGPTRLSDDQMLTALRTLLAKRTYLTQSLIDETKSVPSHNAYKLRFGSVSAAYQLIGYKPEEHRGRPRKGLLPH